MNKNIAIFDVCGTLYRSNTTIDFVIYFLMSRGKIFTALTFQFLQFRIISFFVCRFFAFDLRSRAIRTLKGADQQDIDELAASFVLKKLSLKENSIVISKLYQYLGREDYKVYLASASIDPVIRALGNQLKLNWISSQLEFEASGGCAGYLKKDVTGSKLRALKECFDVDHVDVFFSDNYEDVPISLKVQKFYFVSRSFIKTYRVRKKFSSYDFEILKV